MNSGTKGTEVGQHVSARDRGQALKRAIHAARATAGIDSDTELAVRSRVHYDTLMNWYSGNTVPRPAMVRKVAQVLDVPYGDLLAVYDGTDPEEVPLHEAVQSLIVEIRIALVDERRARADMMQHRGRDAGGNGQRGSTRTDRDDGRRTATRQDRQRVRPVRVSVPSTLTGTDRTTTG